MTPTDPARPRARRRRAERLAADRAQLVATGDDASLAELEARLALAPLCARGRVFAEVGDAGRIRPLAAPARMTVTWLVRRDGDAPGAALERAVAAWAAEMLCGEASGTRALVTGSPEAVDRVEAVLAITGRLPSYVLELVPVTNGVRR